MLTRKLAVAIALAAVSTAALAQTTTGKTDFLGRPIVQRIPLGDTLEPFDPARTLWDDVHHTQSPQAPAAADQHESDQPGERALDAQKDRAVLDAEGFPQYD
jgi:hypothetical protein